MSITSKDNLPTKGSLKDIDWFFDFNNPEAKPRHYWIVGNGIMNIILTLVISYIFFANRVSWILTGVLGVTFGVGCGLYLKKQSYYRFLVYILGITGTSVFLIATKYSWYFLIPALLSLVFLINFMPIDFVPNKSPGIVIRLSKWRYFQTWGGKDKFDDL